MARAAKGWRCWIFKEPSNSLDLLTNHDQRHDQPQHDNITLHAASALRPRFICHAHAIAGGTVHGVGEGTHVPPPPPSCSSSYTLSRYSVTTTTQEQCALLWRTRRLLYKQSDDIFTTILKLYFSIRPRAKARPHPIIISNNPRAPVQGALEGSLWKQPA